MRPDVLALHLSGSLEVIIAVAEADKPIPFAFLCALFSNDTRFLHRSIPDKRFQQRVVGHFACEVTHEKSEMRRVPFKECGITPGLTTASASDGALRLGLGGGYTGRAHRRGGGTLAKAGSGLPTGIFVRVRVCLLPLGYLGFSLWVISTIATALPRRGCRTEGVLDLWDSRAVAVIGILGTIVGGAALIRWLLLIVRVVVGRWRRRRRRRD